MHANFFFQKMFVWVQKSICGWKKTQKIFWGQFQKNFKNLCRRHQKNASHTFSIYVSIMLVHIFQIFYFILYDTPNLCQNKRKVFRKFDDTIFAKCMIFVWLVFFQRLSLWNCMISVFGLWKSTRGYAATKLQKTNIL